MPVSTPQLYSPEAYAVDLRRSRAQFPSPPSPHDALRQQQQQQHHSRSLLWPNSNGRLHHPQLKRESSASNTSLWSLPENFDHRSSTIQEGYKAEPSAESAFILDENASDSSRWSACNQVPLRASQASPEMRRMMGVFRTNPFALHGNTQAPKAAEPLDKPGEIIEWQLPGDRSRYCSQPAHNAQKAVQQPSRSSTAETSAHTYFDATSIWLGEEEPEEPKYGRTPRSYQASVSAHHQPYPYSHVEYGYSFAEVASPGEMQPSVGVQYSRSQSMDISDSRYAYAARPVYGGYSTQQFENGYGSSYRY